MPTAPRSAFITGASSGIGRSLAAWFARRGTRVYAAARRLPELETLAKELQGELQPIALDVTDADATLKAVRDADDRCGGLDLVVANAGVALPSPGDAECWAAVDQMIDVNVRGAAATLIAVADRMAARGHGQLVGISSLSATRGLPRFGAYSASKAYLTTLLEGMRVDLGDRGVAVTTIHPGFVRTPGTDVNKFKMPFLLEVEDAVERIGQAILRKESELSFPWPTATASRLSRLFPNALWDKTARRLDPKLE